MVLHNNIKIGSNKHMGYLGKGSATLVKGHFRETPNKLMIDRDITTVVFILYPTLQNESFN